MFFILLLAFSTKAQAVGRAEFEATLKGWETKYPVIKKIRDNDFFKHTSTAQLVKYYKVKDANAEIILRDVLCLVIKYFEMDLKSTLVSAELLEAYLELYEKEKRVINFESYYNEHA
ncbi:hypothetical protein Bealeia1_01147 [Candidatus Bealeia paramacronuclearis]|uniref:Uncharacterized protein n=1 Tax=Candidatus Bealeia paramacronuclearis TaxID=1921001 RepID=A0ABZ2C3X8_9PROT|nr:hypothetical protein [Candidatus Bealeia paramacronuclearis]